MMSELAFPLLGYALEHLLASGIIALLLLALCGTKAIPPGTKAGILLAALMLSVFGPLLPRPGGGVDAASSASWRADVVPVREADNASGRIEPEAARHASWVPGHLRLGEPAAVLLIAVWGLGAAWRMARQARGHARLRRIVAASKRSRTLEDAYRHLVRSDVEIRLCASFGPAVVGVVRPKILVPERLAASLPADAMRAVLLHEASHIRRNDMAVHALQKILEAVFWWNPAIRWMGASLDVAREIACDVEASRACETPVDYADALLTAIEQVVPSPGVRFAPALGVADAARILDERIDGIIEARAASGATARFATLAVSLCMAAACVAAEAVSRPLVPMPAMVPATPKRTAGQTPERPARHPASAKTGHARSSAALPAHAESAEAARATEEEFERGASRADEEYRQAAALADETFRRAAALADETFRRDAARADEEYRRAAAQADRRQRAAAEEADAADLRRSEALERVAPATAFETRLARVVRTRSQAVSAASGRYGSQMAEANGKYESQMAGAKQRYESPTNALRTD